MKKGWDIMPLYPEITVHLSGEDGNAFYILGAVRRALKRHGISPDKIDECMTEMKSGDYDHLLQTAMKWVDVQ